ncbi:hypothetical protein KP509_33G044000 [Ceratopteris richardii]|uniref:Uncharacterized protein n=1 Tax=Ceratopteris richardii TaxID=49495 RepID=A0A8T2QNI3_CERRI|nr:hypothetical protein KP509_33G044000 [Ceratopteris richardii]
MKKGDARDTYHMGAASASAAHRDVGNILHPHGASILGLGGLHNSVLLGTPVGLLGRRSVYEYESVLQPFMGYNEDRMLCLPAPLPANPAGILLGDGRGVLTSAETDIYGRIRQSEIHRMTFPIHFDGLKRDGRALSGSHFPGHDRFSSLFSARTGVCSYNDVSTYAGGSYYEPQIGGVTNIKLHTSRKKRKTPSADEILKETWDLHSLFRSGHGHALDTQKNKPEGSAFPGKRAKLKQTEASFQNKAFSDWTSHLGNNELIETHESWKETDLSDKTIKDKLPSVKHNDSSTEQEIYTSKLQSGELYEQLPSVKHNDSSTEQEIYTSKLQRSVSEKVENFMSTYSDNSSSDDDSFTDSEDDMPNIVGDSLSDDKNREERAYDFFFQTLSENEELQKLYNEQCHVGKFECLVCSSIPGKPPKKYIGLTSVIMHASKILKTKKKQEHRGYARALCAVMGWNICRLPSVIQSSASDPRCCIPSDKEKNEGAEEE